MIDPLELAPLAATSLVLYGLLAHRTWRLLRVDDPHPTSGFAPIRALIAALPLLGLLASVGGIGATFHALAVATGGAAARAAGAGIGVALGATQAGLVAAIPALVWERLLQRRAVALERQS